MILLACCLGFVTPVFAQANKKKPQPKLPAEAELLKDIEYATPNGISLKLDLYRPKAAKKPVPVIVFVHGGGWKNGNKDRGRRGAWMVPHGFAIASINYRLTDKGQWPDQINDCYAAVRWVRENAKKYNLDDQHVGCWGTSAGGHLVALMGTRTFAGKEKISSRVQAVMDWYGPSELLTMPPNNVGTAALRQISHSPTAQSCSGPRCGTCLSPPGTPVRWTT